MECEVCREKLADFLLDELPEAEAVLVQEHLGLCQTCQATYKQLKGTGRALEAVPAMRPVQPSTKFSSQVMRAAREESEKIMRDLPTERRIRLQQRRQAKPRRQAPATATPKTSPWKGALILLMAGGIALAAILLYYRRATPVDATVLGTLSSMTGRVEQFRPQGGTQWTAAKPGQGLRSGDEFLNDTAGRARFELNGGGSVFLGPLANARFLPPSTEDAPLLRLQKGALGVERGPLAASAVERDWVVECGSWRVRVSSETRAYFKINPDLPAAPPVVTVLRGAVHLALPGQPEEQKVEAGQIATLGPDKPDLKKGGALPGWRADLCDEKELAVFLNGCTRIVARQQHGLQVELNYGFGSGILGNDWRAEKDGAPFSVEGGVLHIANGTRCILNAPLAAPLQVEATVNANVPKECPWGLSLLGSEHGKVSVELGGEAVLSVHLKPVPRVARIGYRTSAQTTERVRVEISENQEGEAVLSTGAGKTQALAIPKKLLEPGEVRFEALGEGLVLDGLRLQGVLPREWILQKLQSAK